MARTRLPKKKWLRQHSLSIVSVLLLVVWIIAYRLSDPTTHLGAFFGNAIADWSGSVVIILGTKFLYEVGSAESRPLKNRKSNRWLELLYEHSLLIFLAVTGIAWLVLYLRLNPGGQMGSGRRQHRFRMAPDGGPRFPDEEPDRTRLKGKPMKYPVILFYKYVEILDADIFAGSQRALCESLDLKGRVLIASEGINGTLAGTAENVNRYVAALKTDPRFSDIEIKHSPGDAGTFPRLVVKVRPEIVALNAGAIPPDKQNHLSPREWKDVMEQNRDVVLLDIRNRFESAAGKFENAVTCDIEHFRELPEYVDRLTDLKEKTVLMYCTGGIRCEKASTLLSGKASTVSFNFTAESPPTRSSSEMNTGRENVSSSISG